MNRCEQCRFYSENWCYEAGIEMNPEAAPCSLGVPDNEEDEL